MPGVPELLEALRGRVKIGVVTNGPSARQRGKLESFGIRPDGLDALAISGEVGAAKPDPAIFRHALARLGVAPERVTMVGDSWENDVLGALGSGMAAVWLNRYRLTCPDPGLAVEINGSSRSGKSSGFWECRRAGVDRWRAGARPYPWRERSSSAPRHIAFSFR